MIRWITGSLVLINLHAVSAVNTVQDLGVHGPLYPVAETPLSQMIDTWLKAYDPDAARAELITNLDGVYTASFDAPVCHANHDKRQKNIAYAPQDLKGIDGGWILRKGDAIAVNLPVGVEDSICFVDGSDLNASLHAVSVMQDEVGCHFIAVANRDLRDYYSHGFDQADVMPFNRVVWERFNMRCMPSVLQLEADHIDRYEFSF